MRFTQWTLNFIRLIFFSSSAIIIRSRGKKYPQWADDSSNSVDHDPECYSPSPASVIISMPSRPWTHCPPATNPLDCLINVDSDKDDDNRSLSPYSHFEAAMIISDRPGSTAVQRPGVLPRCGGGSGLSARHALSNCLSAKCPGDEDSRHYASQQPTILDLTPHRKHRAILVRGPESGDFHAAMRATKYESLRRRDVVYVT